jgi:hypothetical protein
VAATEVQLEALVSSRFVKAAAGVLAFRRPPAALPIVPIPVPPGGAPAR